jgi:hypothetical protein
MEFFEILTCIERTFHNRSENQRHV